MKFNGKHFSEDYLIYSGIYDGSLYIPDGNICHTPTINVSLVNSHGIEMMLIDVISNSFSRFGDIKL